MRVAAPDFIPVLGYLDELILLADGARYTVADVCSRRGLTHTDGRVIVELTPAIANGIANRDSLFAGCRVSFHLQWATAAAKPT